MTNQATRMTDEILEALRIRILSDLAGIKDPAFSTILRLIQLHSYQLDLQTTPKGNEP